MFPKRRVLFNHKKNIVENNLIFCKLNKVISSILSSTFKYLLFSKIKQYQGSAQLLAFFFYNFFLIDSKNFERSDHRKNKDLLKNSTKAIHAFLLFKNIFSPEKFFGFKSKNSRKLFGSGVSLFSKKKKMRKIFFSLVGEKIQINSCFFFFFLKKKGNIFNQSIQLFYFVEILKKKKFFLNQDSKNLIFAFFSIMKGWLPMIAFNNSKNSNFNICLILGVVNNFYIKKKCNKINFFWLSYENIFKKNTAYFHNCSGIIFEKFFNLSNFFSFEDLKKYYWIFFFFSKSFFFLKKKHYAFHKIYLSLKKRKNKKNLKYAYYLRKNLRKFFIFNKMENFLFWNFKFRFFFFSLQNSFVQDLSFKTFLEKKFLFSMNFLNLSKFSISIFSNFSHTINLLFWKKNIRFFCLLENFHNIKKIFIKKLLRLFFIIFKSNDEKNFIFKKESFFFFFFFFLKIFSKNINLKMEKRPWIFFWKKLNRSLCFRIFRFKKFFMLKINNSCKFRKCFIKHIEIKIMEKLNEAIFFFLKQFIPNIFIKKKKMISLSLFKKTKHYIDIVKKKHSFFHNWIFFLSKLEKTCRKNQINLVWHNFFNFSFFSCLIQKNFFFFKFFFFFLNRNFMKRREKRKNYYLFFLFKNLLFIQNMSAKNISYPKSNLKFIKKVDLTSKFNFFLICFLCPKKFFLMGSNVISKTTFCQQFNGLFTGTKFYKTLEKCLPTKNTKKELFFFLVDHNINLKKKIKWKKDLITKSERVHVFSDERIWIPRKKKKGTYLVNQKKIKSFLNIFLFRTKVTQKQSFG